MSLKNSSRLLVVLLALVLLVGACRRAKSPEPALTQSPTETSAVTVAPTTTLQSSMDANASTQVSVAPSASPSASPSAVAPTVVLSPTVIVPTGAASAYPAPGLATPTSTTSSGTPYPAAGTPLPSSTTSSGTPYPLAGTQQNSSAPAQATSTATIPTGGATGTPVSGPGTPTATLPSSGSTTYPGPGAPTQTKIPAPGVTPTAGTPGPTAALTPLSTPAVIRARIQATDPRAFQIVSGQPQLIEFFTYDSPVSRSMAPVVHSLEDRYEDRIRFVYLDLEDPANSLFQSMLKGRMTPFFYLVDGQGAILQEWQGYVPVEDFESALASIGQ